MTINPASTILCFAHDVLKCCVPERPQVLRRNAAPESSLIKFRDVDGAGIVVPILLNYAENGGCFKVASGDTWTGISVARQPLATPDHLSVTLRYSNWMGKEDLEDVKIPWPSDRPELADICQGRTTALGHVKVTIDPNNMMPVPSWDSATKTATYTFQSPPKFTIGTIFIWKNVLLKAIRITEQGAKFDVRGWPGLLTPEVEWR